MGTSSSRHHVTCRDCGHGFQQTIVSADSDEATHFLPNACPKCSGKDLVAYDITRSHRQPGNERLCGRCQGTKRNYSSGLTWVTNAPKEINNSWCSPCIEEVNSGAPAILPGVSIDRDGFVIPGPASLFKLEVKPESCKGCGKPVQLGEITCPHCGHTRWGCLGVAFAVGVGLFAAALFLWPGDLGLAGLLMLMGALAVSWAAFQAVKAMLSP